MSPNESRSISEVTLDHVEGQLGIGVSDVVLSQRFLQRPSIPAWRISLHAALPAGSGHDSR